ncbi:retron-type reverse transcriptase [Azomonas macrocytogenes]|uniref:Retron-type reverse transcriptase n=1 Tax=Azomonas macrocytogenes TaxID=69962 RepID=A0A839T6V3_AZOMA|nr:retron-type reverse transcriptase [Azomonas macrocytogenes]
MDTDVLKKWLNAGVVNKGMLQATEEGTPQGGVISPTLANLTLDGLESQLKKHLGIKRSGRLKVNVVRYADDFVITADSPEVLEKEVRPWVEQFLVLRGLELAKSLLLTRSFFDQPGTAKALIAVGNIRPTKAMK